MIFQKFQQLFTLHNTGHKILYNYLMELKSQHKSLLFCLYRDHKVYGLNVESLPLSNLYLCKTGKNINEDMIF